MKEILRKVLFTLSDSKSTDYTIGDKSYDTDEIIKERHGLFHCWGETIRCDSETGQKLQEIVAIVEEKETGYVYKVNPNAIIFVKDFKEKK